MVVEQSCIARSFCRVDAGGPVWDGSPTIVEDYDEVGIVLGRGVAG
ncbi:hypothetical protein AA106555_0271 [Neokomagataea thailandica NBRC 106555]|uniref:Uncharacterized protein n=1 Tax=Neokomagataea thailandica NBRC 106555 TaxID=1223520 RepID=A0ABQ0QMN3_9PROT|nr:hypothetical protein AA106555_0271 [Neokomagataea thailandica NBRC 106555]